ncbi:MAG TPA: hypothetical protein VGI27_08010 [Solirubrobacteraceae bacterium]|jgi:VIT1/CCC1 family predicted Fe2+/Mn2+ transporter
MGALIGVLPALPLHEAGKYVAGAYIVLFALVLVYVAIMAIRLSRIERSLGELLEQEQLQAGAGASSEPQAPPAGQQAQQESTLA